MICSQFYSTHIRKDTALMALVSNQIFHRKVPQKTPPLYICVNLADDFDNGNATPNDIDHKQEEFCVLIVGVDPLTIVPVFTRLLEVTKLLLCQTVVLATETTGLPNSCFIQCVIPQTSHFMEGVVLDGNQQGNPCYLVPMLGSFCLPKVVEL